MKEKKQLYFVVLSVLFCAGAMSLLDGVLQPGYGIKSVVKAALFLGIPLCGFLGSAEGRGRLKALFMPKKRELFGALALGGGVYGIILLAYFLLRNVADFSGIASQITADAGVSAENFLFVSLYISFVNSLLEEFFFRGYAFLTLKAHTNRAFAYCFSSALFAVYHLGMMDGWFSPALWLLAMAGLFVGGCIFDRLNEKNGNIYASWLVHMCANFALNTVGFILFGIL